MTKQKYYSIKKLWNSGVDYLLLNGERSNGKSYQAKWLALKIAYTKKDPFTRRKVSRPQFGYIRRSDKEATTDNALEWLGDMDIAEITDGTYTGVCVYRKWIYFCNFDENGVAKRGEAIARIFALSIERQYKSLAFPLVGLLIFEEYITDGAYLPNEPNKLMSLVSTVFRRERGRVILIGNTLSRACPYFKAWELIHAPEQKPGTIDVYEQATDQVREGGTPVTVRIGVELCANLSANSQMFFGQTSKMITSGGWYSEAQPTLTDKAAYNAVFRPIYFYFDSLKFIAKILVKQKSTDYVLFVERTEKELSEAIESGERVISDSFSLAQNVGQALDPAYKVDFAARLLIARGKVAYSDNLCGTEFKLMIKNHALT